MACEGPTRGGQRGGVTLRAVALGLVSVVFMCWLADYQLHVTGSSVLTLSNFPVCALIVFVLWLMIGGLMRVVAPRLALEPGELLTILVMAWAAGAMPARGWPGRMVGNLAAIQHYASPENRWEEILGALLPRWLFPDASGAPAGAWFYTGLPPGESVPWGAWSGPLFWWGMASVATLAMALSIAVIFHRQWVEHERLTFPLASVPVTLVAARPGERVAPIFRERLFWLGFLTVVGPLCWNLLGYLSPNWPPIQIYRDCWSTREEIVRGFPLVSFRVMPPVIGFLYLCDLDILFSLWFFWFLGWLEAGFSTTLGFSVGAVGQKLSGWALVSVHNYGALVFLVVWSVWVARRHLRGAWRAALSRNRGEDNPQGVMTYRTAFLLLGFSIVFLMSFAMRAGMSVAVAVPALLLIFVAFFVVAKYMAATGMAYVTPPSMASGGLLESLVGSSWMSPRSAVGLSLLHGGAFGASPRVFGYGMLPHALKLGDGMGRGRRRLVAAVVLAIAVGASFSTWNVLRLGYTYAGSRMDNYTLRVGPQWEIEAMARRVEAVGRGQGLPPDAGKIGAWAGGLAGAALLTLLRARFAGFALHPVGLAFSASSAATAYWFSIIIVWSCKLLILRVGGLRLYEKAKPFFIGLIVGYAFALILSYGVHEFFPGQVYKVVHDW